VFYLLIVLNGILKYATGSPAQRNIGVIAAKRFCKRW